MPTFAVWHKQRSDFQGRRPDHFPDGFTKVATVAAAGLDDAFRLTNHIDIDWTQGLSVDMVRPGPVRSTSIGDVLVNEMNGESSMVKALGWEKIT